MIINNAAAAAAAAAAAESDAAGTGLVWPRRRAQLHEHLVHVHLAKKQGRYRCSSGRLTTFKYDVIIFDSFPIG